MINTESENTCLECESHSYPNDLGKCDECGSLDFRSDEK